jgi:lysophospholipase L1-like esterase
VTMPLTEATAPNPVKSLVKRLIGRPEAHELGRNVKRNRFNDLLRHEYSGKEPLFDLAGIESTRPDSSRSYFTREGLRIYTLASEYSSDGGHLNALGRRVAAAQLLSFLAGL